MTAGSPRRGTSSRSPVVSLAAALLLATAPGLRALEVNQASQAELERLRGIGPALSDQLLEQRTRRPFSDWDDLQRRVRGIGGATARRLSAAGLTVGGQRLDTQPADAPTTTKPAASGRSPG